MLLKEYLEGVNIFDLINQIEPLPFEPPLQLINLDLRLKVLHGNKTLFDSFETLEPELVANLLSMDFSKKWSDLVVVLSQADNLNPRTELTETITDGETRTSSSNVLGKVSAYNSDALIVNDGSDTSGLDVSDGERTRTLTDTQIDLATSFNMLNVVQQNSILQTVMQDVANYLTLSIYN